MISYICCDGISISRFDRFLISEGLIDMWGVSGQWIGNRDISDHCPIWLLHSLKDWDPKPFHVFNGWFQHKDFISYARSYWSEFSFSGNKMFILKGEMQVTQGEADNVDIWKCLGA